MDSKTKWDRKHTDRLHHKKEPVPNKRLTNLAPYLTGDSAIDFACGFGENSLFLARLNYNVQAFDISPIAVDHLREQANKDELSLKARLSDLTHWTELNIEDNSIDLVVITYYLDRQILPFIKSIIKETGYFFMETFYLTRDNKQDSVSDQYKLHPNELLTEFATWHILYYEENEQEGRQTIFARKQGDGSRPVKKST